MTNKLATMPSQRAAFALISFVLLAIAAGLRLWEITVPDLSVDEHLSTGLVHLGYSELLHEIAGRPPLSFFFQKIFMEASSRNDVWAIRMPSAIAGIFGVLGFSAFLYRLAGVRAGLLGMLLLSTSAFHITYSRDGRYYALLFLAAACLFATLWALLDRPRWGAFVLCVLAAVATALTHYMGFLYIFAACVSIPVALIVSPEWRQRLRNVGGNPNAIGAVIMGMLTLFALMWGYAATLLQHLHWPTPGTPLPEFFDVSPHFLFATASLYVGVSIPVAGLALVLAFAGVIVLWRQSRPLAVLSLSVVVCPFTALWVFRPGHWWEPKYFIFMLPVFVTCLALGIDALARCLNDPRSRWMSRAAAVGITALVVVQNLDRVSAQYRWPDTSLQDFAEDLANWSTSDQGLICGSTEYRRVIDFYLADKNVELRSAVMGDLDGPHWNLSWQPRAWFLYAGKSMTAEPDAALLLSGRLSRLPGHNTMLAFGPNPAQIDFGGTVPATPGPDPGVLIPPGGTVEVPLLISQSGLLTALVVGAHDGAPTEELTLELGNARDNLRRSGSSGTNQPEVFIGQLRPTAGFQRFSLHNSAPQTAWTVQSVELLPTIADGPLVLPAWTFVSVVGEPPLNAVWTEPREGKHLLRDLQSKQSALYRVFFDRAGEIVLSLSALNDAPGTNRYQVVVQGQRPVYHVLEFPLENDSLSTQTTPPIAVQRGAYTIAIGYLGVGLEAFKRNTHNGMVQTLETIQTSGLDSLVLQYVAPGKPPLGED